MTQLDEASAAAVGGELHDLNAIGFSCCYLILACERTQDFDRAAQWCDRLSALCRERGIRSLFAVCRTHYANVLTLRGAWDAAESELTAARDGLAATRPAQASEAVVRLGEERVRAATLEAIAPYRTESGDYRLENVFRYVVASA